MPQPPHCRQKRATSKEETRIIKHRDTDEVVKETLDNIVQELSQKISELSHLIENLPKRLICSSRGCRCDKDVVEPVIVSPSSEVDEKHPILEHNGDCRAHESILKDSHETFDLAIEQAGERANTEFQSELDEQHAKDMPVLLTIAENVISNDVVAVETKIHNAVSRFKSVAGDDCCTKLSRMVCPAFIRKLRQAARKERDYVREQIKKDVDHTFSQKFDMIIGVLILLNCFMMVIQLEHVGYQSEISLGEREADGSWSNAETYFKIVEHIFNGLFILELVIRYGLDGPMIFCDGSILLDMLLVAGASFQIYVMDPLQMDGIPGVNLSLFRMLRFVKFIKIFRLVRVLKLFSHLRVLLKTIVSSFSALIWSMLLLLVIMTMSGLLLSGLLESFIKNPENDLVQRKWVFKYYGTASRAVYTLFEVTLAGCWPNYIRPLIDNVSYWYILFAVGYISIVVFAIIRIITAIFLKETLMIASSDAEMMLQERVKHKETYCSKLQSVFQAVDSSGDGKLSLEEFFEIVENPVVKTWLQLLDMEVHDASALFRLLDNGDGEITYDEFLKGVMRLKGQARSTDIVAMLHSTDKTLNMVSCIMENVWQVLIRLDPAQAAGQGGFVPVTPHVHQMGRKISRSKSWLK